MAVHDIAGELQKVRSRSSLFALFVQVPASKLVYECDRLPAFPSSVQDLVMDQVLETRVVSAILDRLEKDSSNDVQAIAVKTLGLLVKRVSVASVQTICERLASHMLGGKSELRDVYGIGLKTLIADVNAAHGQAVADKVSVRLLEGLRPGAAPSGGAGAGAAASASGAAGAGLAQDLRLECLDVLSALLSRFGSHVRDERLDEARIAALALLLDASQGAYRAVMCCAVL